ncbi:hypothetical protein [Pedobacter jejuensis]|uniref:Uncharacterized protein n=1 Tax=Pedobacter jejuensis TaxID=1268550 RepID=A0A3N0BQN9_9SPHI|nr:hypothetical protein [Pedobacter jejuensis]RNL51329.1 hypothetical protein D7004_16595 [Pedobacter jejuensis]
MLLTIIDFAVIWLWVRQMDPDPSVSIGILLLVPFVVVLNLIIALILYFAKRELSILFVINSVIAGVLMYYLFGKGIDNHQTKRLESWKFKLQDTTYVITHWKLENTFSLSQSTSQGSSIEFLEGKFTKKGNEYYLTTDTTEYLIKNEYFYKFRNSSDSIRLVKIER